jgi:exocyst complex component 4
MVSIRDCLTLYTNLILDYHQAFNTAIQRFSSVVDTISDSQRKVKEIKECLESSKETLECKRFDFLHLWVKSIQFKEMSRILDLMYVLS